MLLRRTPRPSPDEAAPAVPAAAPAAAPLKSRRRPALIALGIALIALGAIGAWWVTTQLSTTTQAVIASRDLSAGQVLTPEDLTTADVNVPAGVPTVPGSDLTSLVGKRATGPIPQGQMLSSSAVSADAFPAAGQAVVGLSLGQGQMPAQNVEPGDTVTIVATPRQGDDPPTGQSAAITATVQSISAAGPDGSVVVDVVVAEGSASTLAALSATGRIALILVPQGA